MLGHFSFKDFVTWNFFGFDGSPPRFAGPAFFMISGYLAMLSLNRSSENLLQSISRRYWSIMFIVMPMLFLVPFLNQVTLTLDPQIFSMHDDFIAGKLVGMDGLVLFFETIFISIAYMNESIWFNLTGIDKFIGTGAFNNAPFWFMAYLIPYIIMLTIWVKSEGWLRFGLLSVLVVAVGPPVLLLSPIFFAGVTAYLIHRRHQNWVIGMA